MFNLLIFKTMRKIAFFLVISSFIGICSAQTKYDSIGNFDVYQTDWALVEISGRFGFIDKKGKEIVAPKYDSIENFDVYQTD